MNNRSTLFVEWLFAGTEPTSERPNHAPSERRFLAEAVSKLEITRFSGVASPFPKCREADTERSGGSIFALDVEAARFDTASTHFRPSTPRCIEGRFQCQTVIPPF